MADINDATPMSDADIIPGKATDGLQQAAPLKGAVDDTGGNAFHAKATEAKQAIKDGTSKLTAQATDKARLYADEGKAKAGSLLDQFSQMLTDAAGTVDERLGEQYGHYARSAAGSVSTLSDSIKAKDIDELVEDARAFVRKSPAVAIGVAAAVGFVVARLVQSGVDSERG